MIRITTYSGIFSGLKVWLNGDEIIDLYGCQNLDKNKEGINKLIKLLQQHTDVQIEEKC